MASKKTYEISVYVLLQLRILPKRMTELLRLVGALIKDDYSNGSNAVVLPLYPHDLHAALRQGWTGLLDRECKFLWTW